MAGQRCSNYIFIIHLKTLLTPFLIFFQDQTDEDYWDSSNASKIGKSKFNLFDDSVVSDFCYEIGLSVAYIFLTHWGRVTCICQ